MPFKISNMSHIFHKGKKVKQSHYRPGQALRVPEVEATRFQDSQQMKVVRLAAISTCRLYPPGNIPGTHFCYRLSQPQGHSVAVKISVHPIRFILVVSKM